MRTWSWSYQTATREAMSREDFCLWPAPSTTRRQSNCLQSANQRSRLRHEHQHGPRPRSKTYAFQAYGVVLITQTIFLFERTHHTSIISYCFGTKITAIPLVQAQHASIVSTVVSNLHHQQRCCYHCSSLSVKLDEQHPEPPVPRIKKHAIIYTNQSSMSPWI